MLVNGMIQHVLVMDYDPFLPYYTSGTRINAWKHLKLAGGWNTIWPTLRNFENFQGFARGWHRVREVCKKSPGLVRMLGIYRRVELGQGIKRKYFP